MSHNAATVSVPDTLLPAHRADTVEDTGLATEFHHWPLPSYIWPALERCYHSIFCSESQLRISGCLTSRVEAWVARRDGRISSLVLFNRDGAQVRVLNEVFAISANALTQFADAVFGHYHETQIISVRAAKLDAPPKHYLHLSAEMSDDYLLNLPATPEQWQQSLSSRTREKLRYYLRRAYQRTPGLTFRTLKVGEFNLAQIKQIIALNRARMHVKGKRFGMSAAEEYQVCQLMLERGQLSIIEIHGKLCAGLLCTRVGGDVFMHVIAHDPAYDDLRLGLLCCALTIEDVIRRRCQRFHFLWGRYDYKTRLGGERQALSRILIFRSTWGLMQQPGHVLSHLMTATRAWLRRYRGRLTTKTKWLSLS